MANGHGGARPNSGPKRGPDGKALKPYKRRESKSSTEHAREPVVEAKVVSQSPPTARPMFSDESVYQILEAFKEQKARANSRARTPDWNPYRIVPERFGPAAIEAKKKKIAMDDNSALMSANQFAVNAWQTGGMMSNSASEGLLFLGYTYLSELSQRPEFRLFGEIMSEEITRKWIDFRGTADESTEEADKPVDRNNDDKEADQRRKQTGEKPRSDARNKEIEKKIRELKDFHDHLKIREVFKSVSAQNEYFGISHLYLDLKGGETEGRMSIGNGRDEISTNKLQQGCLQSLRTIEPIWCYPMAYNASNPLAADFYRPDVWYVMGTEMHRTRLIPFIGRPVPDILKPAYMFGGLSMTQMAQPYVDIWLRTRESVGELIHAFSLMILQTQMATTTQPGGAGGAGGDVLARVALANMFRDNQGMWVIDKNTEDVKNVSAPLSGLDELQAQAQEHMFSVGRIPAVKFAGIQPKGLNASSEGELRAFNDTIHGQQEHLIRAGLTTVLDIAQISLWGKRDPDITYDFLPLHEETPKEKAEIRKIEAETDQIRIDSGVVSQEEARTKLAADAESGYDGIDPDDIPDLMEEEEGGLMPAANAPGEKGPKEPKPSGGAEDEGIDDEDAEDVDISTFDGAMDDGQWQEGKHPRDKDGKFTSGGGSSGGGSQEGGAGKGTEKKPPASATGGPNAAPQKPLKKLDLSNLTKTGSQKGSNPGGVYKAPDGGIFYVKKPKGPAQVKNEIAAAKLYQLAGANTLEYLDAGPDHVATKMEMLKAKNVKDLTPAQRKEAQADFAIHAWLANWDAVGTGGDNVGVGADGKVKILDTGGSMKFRAQGEPKEFGPHVEETQTLTDEKKNPDAAALFDGMTLDQKAESAKRVTEIPNDAIREIVQAAGEDAGLAETLIKRKNDIAKQFGLTPAGDKNPEWEAKHPRGPGGKFAKKLGGEEPSAAEKPSAEQEEVDPSKFKTKKELIAHMLQKGATIPQLAKATGWATFSVPPQAAALGLKLTKEKNAQGETVYKGTPMTDAEKAELKQAAEQAKAKKQGGEASAAKTAPAPALKEAPVPQIKEAPAPKPAPSPAPSNNAKNYPPPTEAEIKKAKKGTPLQMQFVPGEKPTGAYSDAAQKVIDGFNDKWAGKDLTDPAEIAEKVAHFKDATKAINAIADVESKATAAEKAKMAEKAQAEAKAKAEQQALKAAQEAKEKAAQNAQFMKDLGISEKQAEGMIALAKMLGKTGGDLAKDFKHYEQEAKGLGYPITGFQCALIKNYSNGGYSAINKALREGAWTPAQHAYVSMVNKALDAMPKYAGKCMRGTTLTSEQIASYKEGHIIQESAFMSTADHGEGFGGNVKFHITAIGKRGANIKQLSHFAHENEVLFQARTFFKVNKVEKKGGVTEIHLEEWEEH